MLQVSSLLGNRQSLDGGAMFGNAPRAVWGRFYAPDAVGRIELCCRCFLVEDGEKRILLETGVGAFFSPELRERYGVLESEHVLLRSLDELAVSPEDIDVIVLSHLHFDHAGGLLQPYRPGKSLELAFPRAEFVVSEAAFERARAPHLRDRASFIPELPELLLASGRLQLVPDWARALPALGDRFELFWSEGHTKGMCLSLVVGRERTAAFAADLIPGLPWVHLPITMGYDRFPEQLIEEKQALYERLGPSGLLLFTHDPHAAASGLVRESNGKYRGFEPMERLARFDLDCCP